MNVDTPATEILSKFVCPSTSMSPLISAPSATTVPVTVTPVLEVTSLTVLLAPYNFTVSLLVTSIPA